MTRLISKVYGNSVYKKYPKRKKTKRTPATISRRGFVSQVNSRSFYESREWLEKRYNVLKTYGPVCMLCKSTDGKMHVDHIKPRSRYPALELEFSNLQVLCENCNLGKSNRDDTDFRPAFTIK